MSGYFAALAAQVGARAPTMSAAPSRSLEPHVEVQAPSAVASPAPALDVVPTTASAAASMAPITPTTPIAPPATRAEAATLREAGLDSRTRIQESSMTVPAIESVAAARTVHQASVANDRSPVSVAPPIDSEVRSIPSAQPAAQRSTFVTAQPAVGVPSSTELATPLGDATPRASSAVRPEAEARPRPRATDSDRATPIASALSIDVPRTSAPPVQPAPRTEIRIGTISLEVRVPPPAPTPVARPVAPAPAPVAVAASTPSPARFSLQRHYLRWG